MRRGASVPLTTATFAIRPGPTTRLPFSNPQHEFGGLGSGSTETVSTRLSHWPQSLTVHAMGRAVRSYFSRICAPCLKVAHTGGDALQSRWEDVRRETPDAGAQGFR